MKLSSLSFADQACIPELYAFGKIDPKTHITLADNLNPHLVWEDAPVGVKSFAVICHDPDAPTKADDVNQEDREVPADLPRMDFYHWVLIDIDANTNEIAEGEYCTEVLPRGKGGPLTPQGTRQGINDYTSWFAGDRDMAGEYFGYDGPCPPWNDALSHRYIFTVYALDVASLPLEGTFTGPEVLEAIKGHVLGKANLTGTYTLNPDLAPKQVG
jgi:hypothetical protein